MQRHLLLTISEDPSAMYGVRFFSSFFHNKSAIDATLLYIAPDPAAGLPPEEIHNDLERIERRASLVAAKGRQALERAREYILEHGFPARNIHLKLRTKRLGTARDIINEGVEGSYDAVVLGRRGLSRLDELVIDSTSKTLLTTRLNVPIWTCHSPERNRKNVLLAVDGSEASLRAADHVGFMLAEEPEHKATVFTIYNPNKSSHSEAADIVDQARETLVQAGLPAERIREEIVRSTDSTAAIILDEAESKAYAAAALGRTGADKPSIKRLFMGSTSLKLMRSLTRSVLWVSH